MATATMGARQRLSTTTTPDGSTVLTDKAMGWVPRYDTILFAAGTVLPQRIRFFVIPEGRAGNGFAIKTLVHTNQLHSNKLEAHVSITVMGVEIAMYSIGNAANGDAVMRFIRALYEDAHVEFRVDDTVELECRLMDFAKGSGMTGIPFANAPIPQTYLAPAPTIRGRRLLARNITLGSRERWELDIVPNPNNAFLASTIQQGDDFTITAALAGPTTRPIE